MPDSHNRPETYLLSKELEEAVSVSEITARPLLIKGEPGTGKSLLAEYLSLKFKRKLYTWHVKSTSLAKEGLYFYDAVSRLNDSRFVEDKEKVRNIENYIRLGALGEAFSDPNPSVVLIDEIDKADIEFPNDLLLELDRMEFLISETGRRIVAKIRPLTIITSNNEKELPAAFLRRCIFHYIDFPDPAFMGAIITSHFPDIDKNLMKRSLETFYVIRGMDDLKKKPGTSELLDWIQILSHMGAKLSDDTNIPFLGALVKNEEDLRLFR
ncbi:ATP-binding protein [Leptospira perolatii]|uniref:ATP-binding protein n=1 Tax=Leptospira perolatii TaxID=2023191 RepID=A0A2M9ZJR0_9LEPT|nr:MoxR family ATPase [Leptospira perolatii]PJZ69455.1 ATP-binding protein [Leptospira perolatii]PJZ72280.1 ATP-binding protein [Leptospira perolatii]